jgi:hypothetical protein
METPLGDEWVVAYRLFLRERRVVIGEVRVFPAEKRTYEPGVWSAHWLGDLAPVPKGGLRGRLLRRVNLTVPIEPMRELIRQLRLEATTRAGATEAEEWLTGLFGAPVPKDDRPQPTRRGRKPMPLLGLAELARDYEAELVNGNRTPIKTLAAKRGMSTARVRGLIHQARQRPGGALLTAGGQGKSGGTLTERAKAVLRAANRSRRHGSKNVIGKTGKRRSRR